MDWQALQLSLLLGACTAALLLPFAIVVSRWLAWRRFHGRNLVQAVLALPLILPPTVLGYYLLELLGNQSVVGIIFTAVFNDSLVFSFQGLLLASVVFNIPFAVQPIQRAFETIPQDIREAAWCCGLSDWQTFWKIELPLAWPGVLHSGQWDGYNLVIHELAHKLDMLNGSANGLPPLHADMRQSDWAQVMQTAFEHLNAQLDQHPHTEPPIDAYAGENPAEFFAVCSEYFFSAPDLLSAAYPQVYAQLRLFYRQDPLARQQQLATEQHLRHTRPKA